MDIPTCTAGKLCLSPGSSPSPIILAHQMYHFIEIGQKPRVLGMRNSSQYNELFKLAYRHGAALRNQLLL